MVTRDLRPAAIGFQALLNNLEPAGIHTGGGGGNLGFPPTPPPPPKKKFHKQEQKLLFLNHTVSLVIYNKSRLFFNLKISNISLKSTSFNSGPSIATLAKSTR